jgi:hypothetical protein
MSVITVVTIPMMFRQVGWYYVVVAYALAPVMGFSNSYGAGLTDINMGYSYGKLSLFVPAAWAGRDDGIVASLVGCGLLKQLVLISADLTRDFMSHATTSSSPTCPSTTTSGTTAPRRAAPDTQTPSSGSAPSALTGSSPAWSTLADAICRRIRFPVPDAGDVVEESMRMQGSIFKVQAHRRALHLVDGGGVDHALVGSNQEDSEAARGSATATTSRGSIPGAIGVDGSYEPIAPNLNRIDPLRSLS